jgi:HEPN domain-containing protein
VPERYPPEDPREWLNRARSNLVLASMHSEGVYLEDLCFNAQQAVEKAINAPLIQRHVQFPYVHDIAELLTILEAADQEIPPAIRQAARLTRFAVFTRYPGVAPPIRQEEYTEAVRLAGEVLQWVESLIWRLPEEGLDTQ